MGLFDTLNAAVSSSTGQSAIQAMLKKSTDSQLIEWWNNRYNYQNVSEETMQVAEREMQKRGLL